MEKAKKSIRTQQLESLALKRFKVGVITMGLHNFTIMATSDKDAVDKIISGRGGTDAGKEGPIPFGFRVQDMAIIQAPVTLHQIMQEIGQKGVPPTAPPAGKQPQIVVPGK